MRALACASALALFAAPAVARADTGGADDVSHHNFTLPREANAISVEGSLLGVFRTDQDYFKHGRIFGYPIPSSALGGVIDAGYELFPRVSVHASFASATDGADRRFAKLSLDSRTVMIHARVAVLRGKFDAFMPQLEVSGGFGYTWLDEKFVDPSVSQTTYVHSAQDWVGHLGIHGSVAIYALTLGLSYGYQGSAATISDRLGGTVSASGHEISFSIGARI